MNADPIVWIAFAALWFASAILIHRLARALRRGDRLQEQVSRLRRERDYYRALAGIEMLAPGTKIIVDGDDRLDYHLDPRSPV